MLASRANRLIIILLFNAVLIAIGIFILELTFGNWINQDNLNKLNYEARHNVEIEHSLSHNFDMHGGCDRKDGTNIAGEWIKIHHNTFRGKTIRAINIRGIPREKAVVHNNWFFHQKPGESVMLPWPISNKNHIEFNNNAFGTEKYRVLEVK